MFRSASLFIGTSFTVAVFTIVATSNVDLIVGIPHKIYLMQRILIHIKKPISLLNVPICTQGMQRIWWPEAGTIIVTGPYCLGQCRGIGWCNIATTKIYCHLALSYSDCVMLWTDLRTWTCFSSMACYWITWINGLLLVVTHLTTRTITLVVQ